MLCGTIWFGQFPSCSGQVRPSDAGRYLCTLETFPKQSLIFLLQVNGGWMELVRNSLINLQLNLDKRLVTKHYTAHWGSHLIETPGNKVT